MTAFRMVSSSDSSSGSDSGSSSGSEDAFVAPPSFSLGPGSGIKASELLSRYIEARETRNDQPRQLPPARSIFPSKSQSKSLLDDDLPLETLLEHLGKALNMPPSWKPKKVLKSASVNTIFDVRMALASGVWKDVKGDPYIKWWLEQLVWKGLQKSRKEWLIDSMNAKFQKVTLLLNASSVKDSDSNAGEGKRKERDIIRTNAEAFNDASVEAKGALDRDEETFKDAPSSPLTMTADHDLTPPLVPRRREPPAANLELLDEVVSPSATTVSTGATAATIDADQHSSDQLLQMIFKKAEPGNQLDAALEAASVGTKIHADQYTSEELLKLVFEERRGESLPADEADKENRRSAPSVSAARAPGIRVKPNDPSKLIVTLGGGTTYETERYCPHKRADLARGALSGSRLICPKHKWQFDLASNGRCTNKAGYRLAACQVAMDW